jgi:hypothetical protein
MGRDLFAIVRKICVMHSGQTITHFDDELDFGDVSLAIPVGAVGHFNEVKCGRRE